MSEDSAWVFFGLKTKHSKYSSEQDEYLRQEGEGLKSLLESHSIPIQLVHKAEWKDAVVALENKESLYEVVVFAGHGKTTGLLFDQSMPQIHILARLIAELKELKLLILNCCESEPLGRAVLEERRRKYQEDELIVFCWNTEVEFQGAKEFNLKFCEIILKEMKKIKSRQKTTTAKAEGSDMNHTRQHDPEAGRMNRSVRHTEVQKDKTFREIDGRVKAERGNENITVVENVGMDRHDRLSDISKTLRGMLIRKALYESIKAISAMYTISPTSTTGVYLGEPVLLPFISTQVSYQNRMLAKYKVAETGIELVKRLKTLVRNGYLQIAKSKQLVQQKRSRRAWSETTTAGSDQRGEHEIDKENNSESLAKVFNNAEMTTLYHFGEFLAWLQLMREEEPELYQDKFVVGVESAFSKEYVDLRTLLGKSLVGDYSGVIYPGCLTLYTMDIRAIAEIMRKNPEDRFSIRQFIDFSNLWLMSVHDRHNRRENQVQQARPVVERGVAGMDQGKEGGELRRDRKHNVRQEEVEDFRDSFAKLLYSVKVLGFIPEQHSMRCKSSSSFGTRVGTRIGSILAWFFPDLAMRNILWVRPPLPKHNMLYTFVDGKCVLSRNTTTYRKIAAIHDSILNLVRELDPSIEAEMNTQSGKIFEPFCDMDAAIFVQPSGGMIKTTGLFKKWTMTSSILVIPTALTAAFLLSRRVGLALR